MDYISKVGIDYLKSAQAGDKYAEEKLIILIRDKFMMRRISKFLHRNRQVEDEDLKQEFMIGVALSIHKARLDLGDPIEYLIQQGVYKVRSYLRRGIMKGTMQICKECGHITRLNRKGGTYVCKKCGCTQVVTDEVEDHDEIIYENIEESHKFEDDIMADMMVEGFESRLNPGTNMYNLYSILKNGMNRDNPNIKNYIHDIASEWGGCSEQNVIQYMEKLKAKLNQYAVEIGVIIDNDKFNV